MNLDVANQVMDSYAQIDREIEEFQSKTHLQCPPGCGWCCENPEVETTPLEMLPLVLELFRRGEADAWLERAEAREFRGQCVFYKPDPMIPGNGRCQVYPWRPSLCRLFGFATVTNKHGQAQLAACVKHKAHQPAQVVAAQEAIAHGQAQAPNFADVAQHLARLDPALAQPRLPINEALKVAIERVGIYLQLAASD